MKYNIVGPWYHNLEKRKLLTERLNIIFFYNERDVKECLNSIKDYFLKITIVEALINKLKRILNEFFQIKYSKDIKELDNFEKEIKEGMMNIITKEEIQNKKEYFNRLLPNLEKLETLRRSKFFGEFYSNLKKASPLLKEDEIFKQTENKFEKLKLLFDYNWVNIIEESIIKECYKAIKGLEEEEIENQINILKKYFKLNVDDLMINKIKDEIIIFMKKEEIFQTAKSCLHFIQELEATQTDCFEQLIKLRDDISKNIDVDTMREYGRLFEKYGINILEQEPKDKVCLEILNALYNRKDSLKFIINITPEDCHKLEKFVLEEENIFLTEAEIEAVEKCSIFINNILGDKKVKKADKDLISSFINEVIKEKNISTYFHNYLNNYGTIRDLFYQKLKLSKIKNILKDSGFNLTTENNKESYFKFVGKFRNEEEQNQLIEYDELIKLREIAIQRNNLRKDKSKEEEENFRINKEFIERINEMEAIIILLNKIAEKGSEKINVYIHIQNSIPKFYNGLFNGYEECSNHLNKILQEINEMKDNCNKNEGIKLNEDNKNINESKEEHSKENLNKHYEELLNVINEERRKNLNLNNQLIKLTDELILEKSQNKNINVELNNSRDILNEKDKIICDLNNQLNQLKSELLFEKNNITLLNNQLKKMNEELIFEKNLNNNYQLKISELSKSADEGREKTQLLFENAASELKSFNNISNNLNEFKLKTEIDMKNKEIKDLKNKISRYPFDLSEEEKIITITFISFDENIISSFLCKNTDKFSEIVKKFYDKYPDYKNNNSFMINGNLISENINLAQENINNNTIITFNKNN